MKSAELTGEFIKKAEESSARVVQVQSSGAVADYLINLAGSFDPAGIAAVGLPEDIITDLEKQSEDRGISLLIRNLRGEDDYRLGVTVADYGVASTGSIVIQDQDEDVRLAGMLSETHVVILEECRIVPDLTSIASDISNGFSSKGSYTAIITGPSRTADIERQLTLGVHGPGELHIVMLKADDGLQVD